MSATRSSGSDAWMEMARKLRNARKEAGLSQANLAEQTGISRVAVSEIESARRKVNSLELAELARVLGRDAEYFLGTARAEETFGSSPTIGHLARAARQLAPEDQQQLVRFAEYLRQQSQRRHGGSG